MSAQASSSHYIPKQLPVAKGSGILTRQRSSRNLYKQGGKAATHDAMIHRFQLRKMSSGAIFQSKFGRASDVVIDKAIGSKLQQTRRFSLRRFVRSITSAKARHRAYQSLTSPITPKSWTSTIHGIVMLAIYHFQFLYLPFFASYYPNGSEKTTAIGILVETIFLLDILLNFNTAFVAQGVLINSRRKIARNYVRKWFCFDLLSAAPIHAIHCIATSSVEYTHPAVRDIQIILMILRLLRGALIEKGVLVSRVMRIASHLTEWLRYSRYSHLLGIGQLMWVVLLFAHYMACLWHVVHRGNFSHTRTDKPVAEQYIADYYYAVSLIQGQGRDDGTWCEDLYSSVAIIMGSVILAIVFGNVAMLVSNFNANSTNYHRKMEAVFSTMRKMDLPPRLRERVNEYYKHVWHEYEALDGNVNKLQQELTHTLGIEIGLYKHMNLVVKVSFWEDCTPDFLTQIVLNLDVRVYMPDDYVVRRREIGSEVMMINRGYCKLSKPGKGSTADNAVEESTTVGDAPKPLLSSPDFLRNDPVDMDEELADENDSDESSDGEVDDFFRGGMFGSPIDSRRLSGNPFDQPGYHPTDFTDFNRFRHVHPRRPSYPTGVSADTKKAKRHREYLQPGQAFGEMSLLMNYKRTANIRAVTFVEMCVLDRNTFQQIISRYPEDRRRVLTKMLESCIEKKVIPFPWEKIIEAVAAKRKTSGKKNISRASVIATMTATEAARILVEAIDVSTPDESIKYGFQNFDQEFIDDSLLRDANSTDAKISDTLERRGSSVRSSSRRNSWAEASVDSKSNISVAMDLNSEALTAPCSCEKPDNSTLNNLLVLMQSMAVNIERLQQDVSELKSRNCRPDCTEPPAVASPSVKLAPRSSRSMDRLHKTMKEDQLTQTARKASIVSIPAANPKTSSLVASTTQPEISILRKIRSNMQEATPRVQAYAVRAETTAVGRTTPLEVLPKGPVEMLPKAEDPLPQHEAERYPPTLSSRSKASKTPRNPTYTDMLWKRSSMSGDLLRHTEVERTAARVRREMRTRLSLPSELTGETDPSDETKPSEPDEPVHPWLPKTQRATEFRSEPQRKLP